MIRRRSDAQQSNSDVSNQKILISSRFHYYEPSTTSLKIPVVIFEDSSLIEFNTLKACIISIDKKIMFLMTNNYNYYIIQITDSFIKMIRNYKFVIFADKTIYSGKEQSNDGIQIPLYINEQGVK